MLKKGDFKRFWNKLKKDKVYSAKVLVTSLIIILFILIVLYIYVPKNCNYDNECFQKALNSCSRAKVFKVVDANTYLYETKGSFGDNCLLNIKVMELASIQDSYIKQKLEGRGMICKLPKEEVANLDIEKIDNILDYCTGPLKESMLELILQKFYEYVVQNIGNISIEMQKQLTNKPLTQ